MHLLKIILSFIFVILCLTNTIVNGAQVAILQNDKKTDESKNKNDKDQKEDAKVNAPRPIAEACKKSYSLENVGQLNQLASQCHTIKGSLNFDNYVDPVVDLGGIENIEGDLVMENSASIVRIDCPKLATIKGEFKIQALTSLTSIHLRELNAVDSIYWRVVPILSTVEFTKGLTKINKITISDTSLVGFEGFSGGKVEQLSIFNINNNRFMESIVCNVRSVSEKLTIQSNAREIQVSLDNLVWANNMTVKDSSSISIPNLQFVNNSLEFIDNHFQSISIPKLQGVGGTLSLDSNKQLTKVDMNNVSDVFGGIMITDNTNLEKIDFLKSLQQIGGAIQFSGKIKEISLPKLRLVKGSVQINSTSDELDCSSWTTPPSGISIIRGGKILCSSSKKQTKISLSDKGEILNTDTTDLELNQQKKEIISKSFGNKLDFSTNISLIIGAISLILTFVITKNMQH